MISQETKARIAQEAIAHAYAIEDNDLRNYSEQAYIAGAEAEAERAQPLVELLEYLERWFNENPLSGRIHEALTKYNNPK